jgi:hypothetical protein
VVVMKPAVPLRWMTQGQHSDGTCVTGGEGYELVADVSDDDVGDGANQARCMRMDAAHILPTTRPEPSGIDVKIHEASTHVKPCVR